MHPDPAPPGASRAWRGGAGAESRVVPSGGLRYRHNCAVLPILLLPTHAWGLSVRGPQAPRGSQGLPVTRDRPACRDLLSAACAIKPAVTLLRPTRLLCAVIVVGAARRAAGRLSRAGLRLGALGTHARPPSPRLLPSSQTESPSLLNSLPALPSALQRKLILIIYFVSPDLSKIVSFQRVINTKFVRDFMLFSVLSL